LKYGALSVPTGQIRVKWRLYPAPVSDTPQRRLVLDWQESGVPITDLQPSRSGFGRELIEYGLPYELGASTRLEFRPGGVRCLIEFTYAEREAGTTMLMDPS
jgi:two-component system CheB/CheR fusion protein